MQLTSSSHYLENTPHFRKESVNVRYMDRHGPFGIKSGVDNIGPTRVLIRFPLYRVIGLIGLLAVNEPRKVSQFYGMSIIPIIQ